ncbi:MAG TPA: hypothetical protein VGN20_19165 [Mucilaginibacter sp.]|jgi:hypothetical protein
MKKLQLKALEIGAKEVLSRAQLKNVLGGTGTDTSGPGYFKCCPGGDKNSPQCSTCSFVPSGSHCTCTQGTCTSVTSPC